ncbi:MAG: FhaA domain-containing protein [Ilumatobacteraceae bacterium]
MGHMVEGVFSRAFRGNVRPIEIGRRLIKEIDANRSVDSKNRRVVPNHFLVHLSPADLESLEAVRNDLLSELVEAVKEYASDEGYHLKGSVSVAIDADSNVKTGRIKVSSEIRATGTTATIASLVLPDDRRLVLGQSELVVGRLAENDIVFDDSNVSRRHARIAPSTNGWVVTDLGSTNGTKVNGVVIGGERSLRDGDIITVGGHSIRYEAR